MLPATISVAGMTPIFGAAVAAGAAVERDEDELASDMRGSLMDVVRLRWRGPAPVRRFPEWIAVLLNDAMLSR
ncbi:hypothetical protein [Burkholderia diffusa]|uniref:hypothetical protein n=1 Tax=Burkholderia diffusa TaxID=488732 RepID=UPI0018C73C34|nr:hypothetical protein [Burkholderia diffusa]